MKWLLALAILVASGQTIAQSSSEMDDIEAELNAVQGEPIPEPEIFEEPPALTRPAQQNLKPNPSRDSRPSRNSRSARLQVDEEMRQQDEMIRRKEDEFGRISEDRNTNRFPQEKPLFVKPPGPKKGGPVRVEHPKAAQGLLRINKDGSYQYRTELKEKSRSGAFRVGMMTPPQIGASGDTVTYENMYGSDSLYALEFDYTWQPFRSFGALGLKVGTGFATVTGKGYFKQPRTNASGEIIRPEESYSLYVIPISAFLEYRFEYVRRQWIVPFISGGGIYYGMAEVRNDGKAPTFAASPALGGGGGFLFSISRLDAANAFTLSQEYGIADMWLTVEARAMQGLSNDLNFTNQTIGAGIAVDF